MNNLKKNWKQICDPSQTEIGVWWCFSVLTLSHRRLFWVWVSWNKLNETTLNPFLMTLLLNTVQVWIFDYTHDKPIQRGDKITATNQLRGEWKQKWCASHIPSASALKRDNLILLISLRHHRRRHYHWRWHARTDRYAGFPFTNRSTSCRTKTSNRYVHGGERLQ